MLFEIKKEKNINKVEYKKEKTYKLCVVVLCWFICKVKVVLNRVKFVQQECPRLVRIRVRRVLEFLGEVLICRPVVC